MIETVNLTKSYTANGSPVKAVDNASMSVAKGEFVSIAGHSGSGKTTLLSLIGGLTKAESGTVLIDGSDIWSMDDDALSRFRNRKINFVYQFSSLIPTLTVFENVLLPTAFGQYGEDTGEYALELLNKVGLTDKASSYPSQLSGGQQRRVAIARAFINRPTIILADEPTGDLDEETEREIIGLFREMNESAGITFIIVTHNKDIAAQTKRRFKMVNGVLSEAP